MRKSILFKPIALLLFAVFAMSDWQVQAQSFAEIGTGTAVNTTTGLAPININWRRRVIQMVYTQSELSAAGMSANSLVDQLGWFVTQSPIYSIPDYTIKLKHVTAANVSADLGLNDWTEVRMGFTYSPASGGWDMIPFDQPFVWNGVDNIGIEICWSQIQPAFNGSGQLRINTVTAGMRHTSTDAVGTSCGASPGTVDNNRPHVRFRHAPNAACSGTPTGGSAGASPLITCQFNPVQLTLTGHSLAAGLTYQWFQSTNAVTYNMILGANSPNYITAVAFAGNNYYRCQVTCTASGQSAISSSILVTGGQTLNGNYTIDNTNPTGGTNFNNFQDAFAALACGSSGPVTMNVTAGQTFSSTGALVANFSGSAANPIVFQKSGAGANPSISFTGTSGTADAGLRLFGANWITWDGIDINQGGTAAADWMEYGIHIQKATGNDGSSNNTFQNFSINMGANTATTVRGVFMENVTAASSASGASSNNTFSNLTISNVNSAGIWLAGSTTVGNQDVGNSILNCTVTMKDIAVIAYGLYLTGQQDFIVSGNNVGNFNRTNTSALYPLYVTGSATTTSGSFTNNTVENISNSAAGILYGIYVFNGGAIDVTNNIVRNLSTTGEIRGIYSNAVAATVCTISRNRIYGINTNSVGTAYAAGIHSALGTNYIYNNMITGITGNTSTQATATGASGIHVSGGVLHQIYNNTVIISGSGVRSAALSWSSTTANLLDVKNNIFVNNASGSTFAAAMYRSTAGVPNFNASSGNNLYYAGAAPSASRPIYRNGASSSQDLASYIGLGVESVAFTEDLQFTVTNGEVEIDQNVATYVESNGQNLVDISIDYYGTARGPYPLAGQQPNGGTATDIGAEENDFLKNVPAVAPDCATLNTPADNETDICATSSTTLSWTPAISGPLPTQGYDVFFGTTNPPAFVDNVNTTSYEVSGLDAGVTYYWSVEPKNDVGNATGCDVFSFTTANHQITSTTPGSVCGLGTVDLAASASSGDINWYENATGGTPIGSGANFTTPVLNTTTTYYVSTNLGGSTFNGGRIAPNTTTGVNLSNYLQQFTITEDITLNSVQVFSTTGTAVTISLYNSTGTTLLETTGSVPVVAASSPNINLGWFIPAGTYRLGAVSMTGAFIRENPASPGFTYPIPLGSVGQIDGYSTTITGALTPISNIYYYVYNWNISTGCESPRVPVVATVDVADLINITPSANNTCPNDLVNLAASSANTNYTYTWMPGNISGASIDVNPLVTTEYEVTGTDGICTATETVTITVLPSAVAGTASGSDICVSGPTTLNLIGSTGDIQWQSFDGVDWVNEVGAGSTTTVYEVSPTSATDYRAQVTVVGCPSLFSNTVSINIIDPQLASTTGDSRCGEGLVDLNAIPAGSASVVWFADAVGGTPLAEGNDYSPYVTQTTTFYAAAVDGDVPQNVGYTDPTGATSGAGLANFGIVFDALSQFTLAQVTVYPVSATSEAGELTIDIIDENNNVLNTGVFQVVGSPIAALNPVVLPLNFTVAPGTNLKLRCSVRTGVTGLAFQPSAAAPGGNWGYPFVIPGVVSLNHSTLTAAPTNTQRLDLYYYFYDWVVGVGCEGNRVPVVATVVPADEVNINASDLTVCSGEQVTLTASSANTNYVYTWNPGNITGASINVNPTENTTYTVSADDGTCFAQQSVEITTQGAVLGTISNDFIICAGSGADITLTGSVGDIQWQSFNGSWNNIPGANNATVNVSPASTTQYRAAVGFVGCPTIFTDAMTLTVSNPQILGTQDDVICGAGDVTVQATPSAGSTIEWFDAPVGGNSLGTGNSLTTNIAATTTFYAQASQVGGTANGGKPAPTSTDNTSGTNWGLVFDVVNPTTLVSVDVYPNNAAGGSMVIELRNSAGGLIQTVGTFTYPAGNGTVPHTLTLNLPLSPGTGYRLVSGAGMTGNLVREFAAQNSFPYLSSDNNVTVTSGFITNPGSTTYYWFYNWITSSVCESPRVPVTGTVSSICALTQLQANFCNISGVTMDMPLRAINVNAPAYRFRITGANSGGQGWSANTFILDRPSRDFKFSQVPGSLWGTTYAVEVAVGDGFGNFGPYGSACNVTLIGIPTTQLVAANCNAVNVDPTVNLLAEAVTTATGYRFRVNGANVNNVVVTKTMGGGAMRKLKMQEVAGIMPGETYAVEVAIRDASGNWGAYGLACDVTLMGAPDFVINDDIEMIQTRDLSATEFGVNASHNPFTTDFGIQVLHANDTEHFNVAIYDMSGKLIERNTIAPMDIESARFGQNLASGMYMIEVRQGSNQAVIRQVKN